MSHLCSLFVIMNNTVTVRIISRFCFSSLANMIVFSICNFQDASTNVHLGWFKRASMGSSQLILADEYELRCSWISRYPWNTIRKLNHLRLGCKLYFEEACHWYEIPDKDMSIEACILTIFRRLYLFLLSEFIWILD